MLHQHGNVACTPPLLPLGSAMVLISWTLLITLLWPSHRWFSTISTTSASSFGGGSTAIGGENSGGGFSTGCPRVCFCNTPSKIVYCSRRGLTAIPDDIAEDSQQINLNGNGFESHVVRRANISRYSELEHLYLSECALEAIEADAFMDLANLKWLDLSNNRLKSISEHTFRGLLLQHLFLNGNRNLQLSLESFQGLSVTGLYLHDCSLNAIQPELFQPLNTTLRYLWLNGNELERLGKRVGDLFVGLSHLRLGFNPLNCNCEAVWLKEFYDANVDMFKGAMSPSCLKPARLKGRYFNELTASDFRCQTPMFTKVEAHFERNEGQLTCGAVGEPPPSLYWIQPSGKTTKFDPTPADSDGLGETDVSERIEGVLSFSWGDNISSPHSGMYICIAKNEAGNVTLTVNIPSLHGKTAYAYRQGDPRTPPSWPATQVHRRVTPTPRPRTDAPYKNFELDASVVNQIQSRLLSDSLSLRASGAPPTRPRDPHDWVMRHNHTSLDVEDTGVPPRYTHTDVDLKSAGGERLFTVAELTWAVVSTHLLTLLVSLIALTALSRTRYKGSLASCCSSRCCCLGPSAYELHRLQVKRGGAEQRLQPAAVSSCASSTYGGTHKSMMTSSDDVTECVYLNGLRHHRLQSYTDTSGSARRS